MSRFAIGAAVRFRGARRATLAVVLIVLLAPAIALANHSNPQLTGGPGRSLPLRPPAPLAPAAPAVVHLTYYGGRVVSNMQVVQVLYGTGSYLSNVSSIDSPSMATFYQGVLNSAYMDWLTEYNTNITAFGGIPGTNQIIGHGSFVGQYTITPSAHGSSISDSQIQNELASQIQAGHLPAPTTDAAGNNNTYYAIFFPHGLTITLGGSSSCVSGGFCAYHGTIANVGGHEIYYGVHPDMQAGSGCDSGCGSGTTFQNNTSVASHEMIETITDAEVGIAFFLAPPLAWYDNANGEIGDICNAQHGTVVGSDSVTYTVQKEWSNVANACIVSRPATATPTATGTQIGGPTGTPTNTPTVSSTATPTVTSSITPTPTATPEDSGFVPPNVNTLQCERSVAKNLRKLTTCIGTCHLTAAQSAFDGVSFDGEGCENTCRATYNASSGTIIATGTCPACLDASTQKGLADQAEATLDNANGALFCAGSAPFGGDDPGFIPPDAGTLSCEKTVAGSIRKVRACIARCHIKAAKAAFNHMSFDEEACENTNPATSCRAVYDAAAATVLAGGACPPCLDAAQQASLADQIDATLDADNGALFCFGSTPLP